MEVAQLKTTLTENISAHYETLLLEAYPLSKYLNALLGNEDAAELKAYVSSILAERDELLAYATSLTTTEVADDYDREVAEVSTEVAADISETLTEDQERALASALASIAE